MEERVKPTIVGEQNPWGGDDRYALYPSPDGCSGHRLCCLILKMRRSHYLQSFERLNLVQGPWSAKIARQRAEELWSAIDTPRKFILLGAKVCAAFQVPFVPFEISEGGTMLVLPHPSGRNRLWLEDGMYRKCRDAVVTFAPELAEMVGAAVEL